MVVREGAINKITSNLGNELDRLDLSIIKELHFDARQSHRELAKKLGTSPMTVHRRMRKLLAQEVITITTIADPRALGYLTRVAIGINARAGQASTLADQLSQSPSVQHILLTTGRFDIVAMAVFQGPEDMLGFFTDVLSTMDDIAEFETMMNLKLVKNSWTYLGTGDYVPQDEHPFRNLDMGDVALIRELEMNPRQTNTELGKKLGMSRTGATRKLKSLLDDKIIKIVSIPNPFVLGYSMRVAILIKTRPGKIEAVAEEISRYRSIMACLITSGRFDVIAWGVFRNSEDMSTFIGSDLGRIDGVVRHETMVNVAVAKRSFSLLTS